MSDRWSRRRVSGPVDPDAARFRAASLSIGVRVAAMSAAMIVLGAIGLLTVLWWKTSHDAVTDPHDAIITLVLDPGDLVVGALVVAVFAVVVAGLAAMAMARRAVAPLEDSMRRQRRFVADASHELRTPIAVLSARTQQLGILTRDDERLAPVVAELRTDCDALSAVVDDLLVSASGTGADAPAASGDSTSRAGADGPTGGAARAAEPQASTALAPVAERVAQDQRVLAAPRAVTVTVDVPDVAVALAATPLTRALTALVDNAVGHAPQGGSVAVTGEVTGRCVLVRVVDDGPGITGIDPADVFDRFAHGTSPAHPGRSSHGIGLALVRDVAARAGGRAVVESTGPDGTTMLLELPLAGPGSVPRTGGRR